MRDLEKQIADWRRAMAKASGRRKELVDELEAHLRDEIERLLRAGNSPDDVFQNALANLGAPAALAPEFEKLTIGSRAQWLPVKLARIFMIVLAALLSVFLVRKLGNATMGSLLASHVVCVTLGYSTMFVIGGLGICYVGARWLGAPGPTHQYSLVRAMFQFAHCAVILTAIGIVLGMFWAKDNWSRYWAWDPKETGAAFVIGWAIVISAMRWLKVANLTAVALMGILGNMITAAAWFGVNAGQFTPWLGVFIGSQLLFLAAVPALHVLKKNAVP